MFEYKVTNFDGSEEFYKAHQIWSEGGSVTLLTESKSGNRKYDVVALFNINAIVSIKKVD